MTAKTFHNTCPRNCFGTCSILSFVDEGKLVKVTGDPSHSFTDGRLCAKGYAYTQYVYNPQRLKYPLIQRPRNSGNWERLSWDEALDIIATKLIELNKRYGSNLASSYNKFSGNLGILHYAVEGFFNSIGPHTKPIGNPCLTTGVNAVHFSSGEVTSPDPENMQHAKLIVIWGANPAVTNIQQMKFIFKAKDNGAKIVVIDPVFTDTAAIADIYIQINPGTDGILALTIAKLLVEHGYFDYHFIQKQSVGWEPFKSYLSEHISVEETMKMTGVNLEAIQELTNLYAEIKPCATWTGFGIQRHPNGGQSIRAINTLIAISGNHSVPYGGLYYFHSSLDPMPLHLLNHIGPEHPSVKQSREIDINYFADKAINLTDPPLKFLWIASRNPFSQDQDLQTWNDLFKQLELVVTVDLFMTKTAERSDIVLPATTHFEAYDLNVSYWHYWLSLNEQAIEPYYESKSDLDISRLLSKKLNELSPGFSNFPFEQTELDWIEKEITDEVKQLYSLTNWKDLFSGPSKAKGEKSFTGKFHFFSEEAKINSQPAIPKFIDMKRETKYPFYLFTPQSLLKIHSQYETVQWLNAQSEETTVELNDTVAKNKNIIEGTKVNIFNENGIVTAIAKINPYLPKNVLLVNQAGSQPINKLIVHHSDQLYTHDQMEKGQHSTHFYDIFVDIK